jgi:hypothetical protein
MQLDNTLYCMELRYYKEKIKPSTPHRHDHRQRFGPKIERKLSYTNVFNQF